MERQKNDGFTLVELIVVIILVGIVSAYAASRYIGVGSFSAYAAQEQVISIIRQVQVNRMQSNLGDSSANDSFILSIQNACLGSVEGCNQADDSRSDSIRFNNVTFSPITQVTFDLLGNPEGAMSSGVSITISAPSSQTQVCVNEQGFVSQGGCS